MISETKIYHDDLIKENKFKNHTDFLILNLSARNERKLIKTFLLCFLHQLLRELFNKKNRLLNFTTEYYEMDNKIFQILIHDIIETEEYTLEGIAYHTHIPYDIIFDAAYGITQQFSITLWVRLAELYLQVKPDIIPLLVNKLLEMKNKSVSIISLLQDRKL